MSADRRPATFQTHHFRHRGHHLVYDEYGSGPEVVVYLHALLLDSEMNRDLASALAASGHRVILLDLLGHGRSDKPEHASQYRIDDYAAQVFALLDHLDIPRAIVGGASLGANVSLLAASLAARTGRRPHPGDAGAGVGGAARPPSCSGRSCSASTTAAGSCPSSPHRCAGCPTPASARSTA